MKRLIPVLGALYLAIGILTFGHAASYSYDHAEADYQRCLGNPDGVCIDQGTIDGSMSGLMAGLLWPLYWSWELWS